MKYVNDYDIDNMLMRHNPDTYAWRAANIIRQIMTEANDHSDGWAYWRAPLSACQKMITIAQGYETTEKDWRAAVATIRRFYTTKGIKAGMRQPFMATGGSDAR
jgi:hypothetical protein